MTIHELIGYLTPVLVFALLIVFITAGFYLIGILKQIKVILSSVEKLSDLTSWVSLIKKWPKRNKKSS